MSKNATSKMTYDQKRLRSKNDPNGLYEMWSVECLLPRVFKSQTSKSLSDSK